VDDEVVHHQNRVRSRQPSDIPAFNREMISLFVDRGVKASFSRWGRLKAALSKGFHEFSNLQNITAVTFTPPLDLS
jgi:hypothetical protein